MNIIVDNNNETIGGESKTIIYLHGFGSSGQSGTVKHLRKVLPDGKTPETALCVIDVHQEYEYIQRVVRLSVLQLVKQSVKNGIDCLELEDYDGRIEKVYFDISRCFEVGYLNPSTTLSSDTEGT